jgi:hypothetical protein
VTRGICTFCFEFPNLDPKICKYRSMSCKIYITILFIINGLATVG